MKNNKLIAAMALTMSMTLISCSNDDEKSVQQEVEKQKPIAAKVMESQSEIMSYIPADTPVLMLFAKDPKHPLPQKMIDSLSNVYSSMSDLMKTSITDAMKTAGGDDKKAQAVTEFIDKWFTEEGVQKLGFSMEDTEFAVYTVDLFPVARLTLANNHSMNEVLDELMTNINQDKPGTAVKKQVEGSTVYQMGDSELQAMISLKGNSVAVSFAPTREADQLMPSLLGFKKPAKNIAQSAQFNDTKNKYNYIGNSVYWMNLRELADYFVNPANYNTSMLDVMKIQDGMFSADCKTEILAMVDKFPRIVGGTTVLDDKNLDSHMIVELTDGIGSKMSKMHGRIPKTNSTDAITYGFSFDIAAAKDVALEFVTKIESDPYKCELLANMNTQATTMKAQLSQPLPPFVGNFKGINMVIDELDLDMSKSDPNEMIKSAKGKLLLAVDNPEALQGMAMMAMPDLQKLGLKVGGEAVNVSHMIPIKGTQIPVNLDHVFVAMGADTIGVSLGENTDPSLTKDVSIESESHLMSFQITADLYKNLFASLGAVADKMPEEAKKQIQMQQTMMGDMIWWDNEIINLDFTDQGFEVTVDINY